MPITKNITDVICYAVHDVSKYINWIYFFHAWGFSPKYATITTTHGCMSCRNTWLMSFPTTEQQKAKEAINLYDDAIKVLNEMDSKVVARCMFGLFNANSKGDDIIIGNVVIPTLRQQTATETGKPFLALSDFIRPATYGTPDTIGLFAASVDDGGTDINDDSYKKLLIETLADRIVEAAVEVMHQSIRKTIWGYAPDENLSIKELHSELFQGIRPAVGYPSLPDQSINFIINSLIDMSKIGISLTENGAMSPHSSVSGLMISHPKSKYFSVGKIGEDQLDEYSKRRNINADKMRKFLAANL